MIRLRRWPAWFRPRLVAVALPAAGVLVFITVWWLSIALLVPETSFLSRFGPNRTFTALLDLIATGQLWPHLLASLRRIVVGLALSIAIGFPLGMAVGMLPVFARLSGPAFQFVRMVSPLSWTPLAIILFGVGDGPVYFLIAIAGVWPIVLNTSAGVAALDHRWLLVGRSLGATPWEIVRSIVLPSIRPNVLTGVRLTVGLAWIVLVPAEMLGVDSGLGYFLLDTRDRLAYSDLMASIIVVGLCGFLVDSLVRYLLRERRQEPGGARRLVGPDPQVTRALEASAVRG